MHTKREKREKEKEDNRKARTLTPNVPTTRDQVRSLSPPPAPESSAAGREERGVRLGGRKSPLEGWWA